MKQRSIENEKRKTLGEILTSECRLDEPSIENIDTLLASGADINYSNSKPLYFACKKHSYSVVEHLIEKGAVSSKNAVSIIASICDYKGFDDSKEERFFELLDKARLKTGEYMQLFIPYINSMAVNGRLDKLMGLIKRYYLTEKEVAEAVYLRIIFEIILNNHDDILAFIERHNKWITKEAFDLAVSTGEWIVLEYILNHSNFRIPSDKAVGNAVYEGYFEVLDILRAVGYSFEHKPLFLEKATRAVRTKGARSLEYLLKNGYSVFDTYKGKTIIEHAKEDSNHELRDWFNKHINE